jgi:Uma2 family endonuclease
MTTRDLETLPDPLDDTRYEIIDGELYVSKQPSLGHQYAADSVCAALRSWSAETRAGMAFSAPGVIFAEDDNVAPDVVWVRADRLREAVGPDEKLHEAPDLVVEVLSPGETNERRDRETKRKLYSRRGVLEYWVVDVETRSVSQYRHVGDALELADTVGPGGWIESPLLPGFRCSVDVLFFSGV